MLAVKDGDGFLSVNELKLWITPLRYYCVIYKLNETTIKSCIVHRDHIAKAPGCEHLKMEL